MTIGKFIMELNSQEETMSNITNNNLIITEENRQAFDLINQGCNVFIHGKPGTGKTTFIEQAVDMQKMLQAIYDSASTGKEIVIEG